MRARLGAVIVLSLCSCTSGEPAAEQARDKIEAARGAYDEAVDGARENARAGAEKARAAAEEARAGAERARAWAADLTRDGQLSATAKAWIAGLDGSKLDVVLARGAQMAPAAKATAETLSASISSDTAVEPIYQEIEGEQTPAEVDAAIAEMGRVEVIDGVSVGFRELSSTSAGERVTEKGALVLWRRGDHLVGFVYRSRKEIDIERLVADAPRIIELVNAGLKSPSAGE